MSEEAEAKASAAMANLLGGLLSGTQKFNFATIGTITGSLGNLKGDAWVADGLSTWVAQDPEASTKLAGILSKITTKAPLPLAKAIFTWLITDPNAMTLMLETLTKVQEEAMTNAPPESG